MAVCTPSLTRHDQFFMEVAPTPANRAVGVVFHYFHYFHFNQPQDNNDLHYNVFPFQTTTNQHRPWDSTWESTLRYLLHYGLPLTFSPIVHLVVHLETNWDLRPTPTMFIWRPIGTYRPTPTMESTWESTLRYLLHYGIPLP